MDIVCLITDEIGLDSSDPMLRRDKNGGKKLPWCFTKGYKTNKLQHDTVWKHLGRVNVAVCVKITAFIGSGIGRLLSKVMVGRWVRGEGGGKMEMLEVMLLDGVKS